MSSNLPYRRDVDGLRAIAVLAVVCYHADPHVARGGFVGVDVFFVISGYLISGVILDDLRAGTFAIRRFYARRIKRIFPALALVLIACLGFGWFTLLPNEYDRLGTHVSAGGGFVLNFVLWKESGYFDSAAELPQRTRYGLDPLIAPIDDAMASSLSTLHDAIYVSVWRTLCDGDAGCLTYVDDTPDGLISWDAGHLTTAGATYLARRLPIVEALGP